VKLVVVFMVYGSLLGLEDVVVYFVDVWEGKLVLLGVVEKLVECYWCIGGCLLFDDVIEV